MFLLDDDPSVLKRALRDDIMTALDLQDSDDVAVRRDTDRAITKGFNQLLDPNLVGARINNCGGHARLLMLQARAGSADLARHA